jgi:hypothetical protein
MRQNMIRNGAIVLVAALIGYGTIRTASAEGIIKPGWDGKRRISYQQQKDLFYNYYAQPGPINGAAAGIYPAPRPVPPFVGWTWVTYQPFMPHEFLYRHERSYYTYNAGAGWTRTNVRYGTACLRQQNWVADMNYPRTMNIWPVSNDYFYPGLRF